MREDNTVNMSWVKAFCDKDGVPTFLRKGIIGDWKNHFSPEQSARMDALYDDKIKGTGFELDFE